jgi:hypothetical protein
MNFTVSKISLQQIIHAKENTKAGYMIYSCPLGVEYQSASS